MLKNDRSTKPTLKKPGKWTAPTTIGETAEKLAMAADASLKEAARKVADKTHSAAVTMDDATKRVVAAGSDAAREAVDAGIDVARSAIDAGIDATKEGVAAGNDAAHQLFASNGTAQDTADVAGDAERGISYGAGAPDFGVTTEADKEIELRSERLHEHVKT
jgi:hypothetical protein